MRRTASIPAIFRGAPEGQAAYELSEGESAEVLAILVECGVVREVQS